MSIEDYINQNAVQFFAKTFLRVLTDNKGDLGLNSDRRR